MGDLDIRFYLSLLLRRLPWIVAIVFVFTAGGIAVAFLLPPLYRATAKILVEAPQIPAEMARSTVPISAVQQFEIIEHELVTTDSLAALAARQNVYEAAGANLSVADIADDMRARVSFEQVDLNSPRDGGGATIFNVSFEARNAELAARVVNDLVDSILSKNISLRTGKAGDTMQFFDQETKRLGAELTGLEADILKFKTANKEALPDSLDFRRAQQSSQQERLSQLEREEAALRSRRSNLVEMFRNTGNIVNAGPVSPEQQMLQDMNRALADQLTVFQETSPNIVMLRARIETLRKGLNASHAAASSSGKAGPTELDFQLSDIDERLRFITQEKASITSNLEDLAKTIAATPSNETILNSLERNRANIQAQYNNATAMLAQASTGEQIELRSKGGRLSVVEPAVAPEKPYSPNRRRIAGAGLAAGIGASFGLVVLLELLNKTIRRPSELAALLDSEPLATIGYIPSRTRSWNEVEERLRKNPEGPAPVSQRAA
jgi:uncharacterized protein involved in exopolysaccharide biosynthesis